MPTSILNTPTRSAGFDDPSIIQASRAHRAGDGTLRHRIVLRDLGEGTHDRYVVHYQCYREDGTWSFAQGDYYSSEASARRRFGERGARLYQLYPSFIEERVTR